MFVLIMSTVRLSVLYCLGFVHRGHSETPGKRRLELASGSGSTLLQEFVCLFRNPGLLWDINKSDFDALLLSL